MSALLGSVTGAIDSKAGTGDPGAVTLPAPTTTATASVAPTDNALAYFRFNRDGTYDKLEYTGTGDDATVVSGWTYTGDWVENPSATVGDSFEILSDTSGSGNDSTITTSYQTISSDLLIGDEVTANHGGSSDTTYNITIRY